MALKGVLQSIHSNDLGLDLGVTSTEADGLDLVMFRGLFGYSPNNKFEITRPGNVVLTG